MSGRARGTVQEAVFFSVADLLNLEVDLLFFDTTSTYFEIEEEDEGEDEEGGEALRRFGHSRDRRPDRPQVVVGLAVTRTGIPVRVWVFPGNTADASVVEEVKADLAGWRLGRPIWVVDRGIASEENLRYLRRGGGHWIAGMMRACEEVCEPPSPGPAATARCATTCASRRCGSVRATPLGARSSATTRRRRRRTYRVASGPWSGSPRSSSGSIASGPAPAGLAPPTSAPSARFATTPRTRATCARPPPAACGSTGPRPPPRQGSTVKYLLETSDPELSAEDVALGYKNLLEAERGFRDLKGVLRIRPVFHRLEDRIRAHVLICWLALPLARIAERETGGSWRKMSAELERIKLVTLQGAAGTVEQTTPLSGSQSEILASLEVEPPPAVTSLQPS